MTNNAQQPLSNSASQQTQFTPTFTQELVRYLYSGLWLILLPFTVFVSLYKGITRSKDYLQRLPERYGFFARTNKTGGTLIHCVSVGEVVAATPLIKLLQAQNPNASITITTTTPTGSQRVTDTFGDTVNHVYLPYDLPYAVKSLLNRFQPQTLLITEVELWPNLIHYAWQRQIPVTIVNARLTDRSYRSYAKFPNLFAPMLKKVATLCAQGQRDYNNYLKFGVNPAHVELTNNIKFDQPLTSADMQQAQSFVDELQLTSRQVLIGGSTHDPEEQELIEAYKALKPEFPNLLLLLVPRHPQRFNKVSQLVTSNQLTLQHLSECTSVDLTTDVLLADKMGILKPLYGTATCAFVGGSINNRGGHNALEPAMFAVPTVMGPHTYNNPDICQALLAAKALYTVHNANDITALFRNWLQNESERTLAGNAGKQVVTENSGALAKTLSIINSNQR